MTDDILQQIRNLMQERFSLDPDRLTDETELASLGIDSLAALEFMFEIEDRFGIAFGAQRDDLATVGDVAAAVRRALKAKSPTA